MIYEHAIHSQKSINSSFVLFTSSIFPWSEVWLHLVLRRDVSGKCPGKKGISLIFPAVFWKKVTISVWLHCQFISTQLKKATIWLYSVLQWTTIVLKWHKMHNLFCVFQFCWDLDAWVFLIGASGKEIQCKECIAHVKHMVYV